jgi:SAM-dependent methyltransferase
MASSTKTYDVFVRYEPSDVVAAAEFARRLHAAGLRPWLDIWSAVPGASVADAADFATAASRCVARLIGPSCRADPAPRRLGASSTGASTPSLTVLAPDCPLRPADLPRPRTAGASFDLRGGFETGAWRALIQAIGEAAGQCVADPGRRLHPHSLHRDTIASYDRIAEKFAAQWFDHPPMAALDKLLALLPPEATILDAGCGPGHHAGHLAGRGHRVIGVDLSEGMLRVARRMVRSVPFVRMDARALTFPPRTFDAVWCAAMALHVPREGMLRLLRGFRRVLLPTGILGVNVQIGRRSEVVTCGDDLRFFEYYHQGAEVAGQIERAGFDVVASDYGETTRNTHELDLTLKWMTLYARPRAARPGWEGGGSRRGRARRGD